jgi:hypothetical protein
MNNDLSYRLFLPLWSLAITFEIEDLRFMLMSPFSPLVCYDYGLKKIVHGYELG